MLSSWAPMTPPSPHMIVGTSSISDVLAHLATERWALRISFSVVVGEARS